MTKVSIGLPVYNGEKYIHQVLDSILNQTYDDFELIISDNASEDRTQEICMSYAANDSRIRYYRNGRNLGACWNYNSVFKKSKGEYFKWLAHDDVYAPTHIERCVKIFEQNQDVVLVYPKTVIIDDCGNQISKYDDELHLPYSDPVNRFRHCIFRSAGMCNAVFGLIRSFALNSTSLIGNFNGADYILLSHLALLGEFFEIPEYLFFRRDHPETSGRSNPTPNGVAAWFDPLNRDKIILPECRRLYEYVLVCLMCKDLHVLERVACFAHVCKLFWWNRHKVKVELLGVNKQIHHITLIVK